MKNARWSIGFLCSAIMIFGVGCGSNEPEILSGNCFIPSMSDQTKACIEYAGHEKVKEFKQLCRPVMKGTWSEGACNTEESLGGCQTGDNKLWFFVAAKYQTKTDVEDFCASKDIPYLEPYE